MPVRRLTTSAMSSSSSQTLRDSCLANTWFAGQHRIVLGATREHLDNSADLFVASDHRIELAGLRQLGKIAAISLQSLVLVFWVLVGNALAAAHRLKRLVDVFYIDANIAQPAPDIRRASGKNHRNEQMLCTHEFIVEALRLFY